MKINLKSISYFMLGAALVFSSCKKKNEIIEESINNGGVGTSATVKTTLAGIIKDESNNPISGAQVSVGSTVQFTNNKGAFVFEDIRTDKKRTYVKVSKQGYFDGSRIVEPYEGQLTKISVKLQGNAYVGTISAASGGSVSLNNGSEVMLPANGVVIESTGAVYTGNINVSMAYLDASSNEIGSLAPGDMRAIAASGDNVVLTSYSMLNVELTGDAGEKLQVASGNQATITIPTSISGAPSTIPLWYFDAAEGIWKEDGVATLQGGKYVGNVSHFTIWNVDFPEPPVEIAGYILDCNGNPFTGIEVEIRRASNSAFIGSSITDSLGLYRGPVPTGVALTLNVLGPCGVVYSAAIGPYTTNQTVPSISVCNYNGVIIQGIIKNSCSSNAYAYVEIYEENTSNLLDYTYGNKAYTSILCPTISGVDIVGTTFNGDKDTVNLSSLVSGSINLADTLRFCDANSQLFGGYLKVINYPVNYSYYSHGSGYGTSVSDFPNAIVKSVQYSPNKLAIIVDNDTVIKIFHKETPFMNFNDLYGAQLENSNVDYTDSTYNTFQVLRNGNKILNGNVNKLYSTTLTYVRYTSTLEIGVTPLIPNGQNWFTNYSTIFDNDVLSPYYNTSIKSDTASVYLEGEILLSW